MERVWLGRSNAIQSKLSRLHVKLRLIYAQTKVTSVKRHPSSSDPKSGGHARWTVNTENPGDAEEVFDAVIVTVGTCGEPHMIKFPGLDSFRGPVLHSSELDGDKAKDIDWAGKKVTVIGGGASAVEAVEAALEKDAKFCSVSVREDKVSNQCSSVFGAHSQVVDHSEERRYRHIVVHAALRSRDASQVRPISICHVSDPQSSSKFHS